MRLKALTETYRVYYPGDEAIDQGKSDFGAYGQDFDASHLAFVDGVQPAVFVLRALTPRQQTALQATLADGAGKSTGDAIRALYDGAELAIRYALAGVEGLEDAEGKPFAIERGPDGLLLSTTVEQLASAGLVRYLGEAVFALCLDNPLAQSSEPAS